MPDADWLCAMRGTGAGGAPQLLAGNRSGDSTTILKRDFLAALGTRPARLRPLDAFSGPSKTSSSPCVSTPGSPSFSPPCCWRVERRPPALKRLLKLRALRTVCTANGSSEGSAVLLLLFVWLPRNMRLNRVPPAELPLFSPSTVRVDRFRRKRLARFRGFRLGQSWWRQR